MKADWVKVNPAQGSGDGQVSVASQTEHTGRNARNTILTWKAVNCQDVQCSMYQEADNGGMNLILSGKGAFLWGATGGILSITYTKSSNTFSCDLITA